MKQPVNSQTRSKPTQAGPPAVYRPFNAATAAPPAYKPPVQGKIVRPPSGLPALLQQKPAVHRLSPPPAVLQAKRGPKWTQAQHDARAEDWKLISVQRSQLTEIKDQDEAYFKKYLKEPKKPAFVYRGDGRGVNQATWDNLVFGDITPKPGKADISFFGVVEHTHSNASPGGMVSTTTDMQGAIDWAVDTHPCGIVFEILIDDYIDVNDLLASRNFRNRYEGQHELLIPRSIRRSEVKRAYFYKKENGVPKVVASKSS